MALLSGTKAAGTSNVRASLAYGKPTKEEVINKAPNKALLVIFFIISFLFT
jgi:hypothetical protein